jgi:formate-dependent phosphoribosylglycinamide formyltransferase (GAR transformylase)
VKDPRCAAMERPDLIRRIERALGTKRLIWFGTRGEDAQPLLALANFSEVFSLIAPMQSLSLANEMCLENLRRERLDLDTYSLDEDHSSEAGELRLGLLKSLREPAAVLPYRPLSFLSSVFYPRKGHVDFLGMFHERQAPFEHKPWVETELQAAGVETVPWKYFVDEDRQRVEDELAAFGSLVLRQNKSDGGAGLRLVRDARELDAAWQLHPEGFFAAAPLLHPNVPLNVNACAFADGSVSLHGPSLQLIGPAGLTRRTFGYCGNDFAAPRELPPAIWDEIETMVAKVGRWLVGKGYLGAFGVDALLAGNKVYLTEVNPRFQGSSALSAWLDAEMDRPDLFLCHLIAHLGMEVSSRPTLRELVAAQPQASQVLVHNTAAVATRVIERRDPIASRYRFQLLPTPGIAIAREAVICKAIVPRSVTENGLAIAEEVTREVLGFAATLFSKPTAEGVRTLAADPASAEADVAGTSLRHEDKQENATWSYKNP